MEARIEVFVNGEKREIHARITVGDLVEELELDRRRVAVEFNREILKRAEWNKTEIRENDAIEIVHFVGGGGT